MSDEQTLVFVYGTLMKGERNHERFLSGDGATLIAHAATREHRFMMVVTPSLSTPGRETPSVYPQENGHKLQGQVFAVDDARLAQLDLLEKEYQRSVIELDNGMKTWIYLKPQENIKEFSTTSAHLHPDRVNNAIRWREETP